MVSPVQRLIACFIAPIFLCGCAYDYSAGYEASCPITRSQAISIATDIFHGLGLAPKMTEDYKGQLVVHIPVPYENKPGETVNPSIGIADTDHGFFVTIEDNGKGDSPLSKKMKGLVEQALTRNGCSSWKFDDRASNFSFAK